MVKVAMLSFWHVHAKDYARQAKEHPQTEIVAVWDEIAARGAANANELSVPFYSSLDELLASPNIDGVVVDVPTQMHEEVIVKAAKAGKHIFTEKVLAPTLASCNRIMNAVRESGVKLTVSLPRLNESYTLAIQDILKQELLGKLTLVRIRLSHDGAINEWLPEHFYNLEQCGGGALIDLGCHPMYLTRLFMGLPESVSANYGYVTKKDVEDNAVAVLRYENGGMGIVEAGFVNQCSPFSIELHGTDGTVLYGLPDDKVLLRTVKGSSKADSRFVVYEQSQRKPSAFQQWVNHIQSGTTADENIALAIDLTRLMEACNKSAATNASVSLKSLQA